MNVYGVDYQDEAVTHRASGVEMLIDSTTSRALGAVADGVSGSGESLCGQRVYGVWGAVEGVAPHIPGLCLECEAVWRYQLRRVVPAGWNEAQRDAYWVGFDRGRWFADFMEHYRHEAFGDETINTPWNVSASATLTARFDRGVEDGVRSYVIDGWTPAW